MITVLVLLGVVFMVVSMIGFYADFIKVAICSIVFGLICYGLSIGMAIRHDNEPRTYKIESMTVYHSTKGNIYEFFIEDEKDSYIKLLLPEDVMNQYYDGVDFIISNSDLSKLT